MVVTPEGIRPKIKIPLSYLEGNAGEADEPANEEDEDMDELWDGRAKGDTRTSLGTKTWP